MRYSTWISVDKPLIDGKYLNFEHDGGVLNSFNLNSYAYCRQNPVFYIDPDGNQYNNSILLDKVSITKYAAAHGVAYKYTETFYKFTPATSHLLSLVSGVNKNNIKSTKVEFSTFGGAGASVTVGSDSANATITHYYSKKKTYKETSGSSFYAFLKRNAHEVGHIPQLKDGNVAHLASSLWEYAQNIIDGQDWHDGSHSTKELEADIGENKFKEFNRFVDEYYGGVKTDEKYDKSVMLQKLFKNKNNSQKDIINRINQWWNKFNEMKNEKKR